MSALPSEDPFVAEVLYLLPPQVASRLTESERGQLFEALQKGSPRSRHMIDLRFSVPLVYSGMYVVFQVGRDRRQSNSIGYVERRSTARRWLESGGLLILCLAAVVIGSLLLYYFKSKLGIDLFGNAHLRDVIPVNQSKDWLQHN